VFLAQQKEHAMQNSVPDYQHLDGIHTATWPDGSSIVMEHPYQDKQHYYAFVRAFTAKGALAGETLMRIFDTREAVQFALRCSTVNGASNLDMNQRLIYLATRVRETLMDQAAATPPEPLRRACEEPTPYPVEALGALLAPMVYALRETVQAPDAICGQSVLAAATLAVQTYANVLIDGRRFPVSEYFLDVGESGERRSAVDRCALYPHYTYERSLFDDYAPLHLAYTNDIETWKRAREVILKSKDSREGKRQSLEDLGPPPAAPLSPVFITEEPTYEGLIKLFLCGQRSLGLFSDEGGRFLGGHAMSGENNVKTMTGLSELWDGKRVTRVRATDETVVLYGRRLAMHLMVQPILAETVFSDPLLQGQGLLNRCLVCWPASTAGTRMYKEVDLTQDTRAQRYNTRMQECLQGTPDADPDHPGEVAPRDLPLSRVAKQRWIAFHNATEAQLGPGQALNAIRGFGNKSAEHAARLAGVLTLVNNREATEMQLDALEAGVELIEFYLKEALRLFARATPDPDVLLAEALLSQLHGERVVSLPDIYQKGPEGLRDAKTARRIVALLEGHGWLVRIPGSSEVGGVMRREVWEVRGVCEAL
jgi:hypothetical protein